MSIGAWLQQGCILRGTKQKFAIQQPGRKHVLSLYPTRDGETIFWFSGSLIKQQPQLNSIQTVFNADYELMHKRMGHPSRDVLKQARRHTDKFPSELMFPPTDSICRGCAEAKMHMPTFEDSTSRASRSFELIHSDLKELPITSYHKYKYFVTFLDDYSSHCWVICLRKKSDTIDAIKSFLAMVRTQHGVLVKEFMTDAGGEYKSIDLRDLFDELGIQT